MSDGRRCGFFSSSSLQAEEKVREMEANQGKLCVFDLGVSIGNTVYRSTSSWSLKKVTT